MNFSLSFVHDPLIHTKPQHEAGGTPLGIASKASGIAFKFLYIQFLVQKPFGLCTEILDFERSSSLRSSFINSSLLKLHSCIIVARIWHIDKLFCVIGV